MQVTSAPYYIGIDLAWSPANPSGVAVIDANAGLVKYLYTPSMQTILTLVDRYPLAVIGVDAPLIIPNETGHRPNERAFLKIFARYGLGVHAANTTLFEKRFARYSGFELYEALKARGFDFCHGNLFEVYPHATILACFNRGKVLRYKSSVAKAERITGLKRLQTFMFEVITVPNTMKKTIETLRGNALKAEEDFLDALVCAYTLLYGTSNDCLSFGDDRIGRLLTPDPASSIQPPTV
jgi:predicted RNase H-like nuclease